MRQQMWGRTCRWRCRRFRPNDLRPSGDNPGGNKDKKVEDVEEKDGDENMISSLPKTFQPKERALLNYLKSNGITYDQSHRVTVDGVPITHSNILDILHDLLRYRDVPAPNGFDKLAVELRRINISREFVPNLERYNYIMGLDPPKQSDSSVGEEEMTPSPRAKPSIKINRQTKRLNNKPTKKRHWVSW